MYNKMYNVIVMFNSSKQKQIFLLLCEILLTDVVDDTLAFTTRRTYAWIQLKVY